MCVCVYASSVCGERERERRMLGIFFCVFPLDTYICTQCTFMFRSIENAQMHRDVVSSALVCVFAVCLRLEKLGGKKNT